MVNVYGAREALAIVSRTVRGLNLDKTDDASKLTLILDNGTVVHIAGTFTIDITTRE